MMAGNTPSKNEENKQTKKISEKKEGKIEIEKPKEEKKKVNNIQEKLNAEGNQKKNET